MGRNRPFLGLLFLFCGKRYPVGMNEIRHKPAAGQWLSASDYFNLRK
jgi:hypothetical protein